MPRTLHVLGFRADGSDELVIGSRNPITDTLNRFHSYKSSGMLPSGIVKLELYDSENGVLIALPHDGGASHRAEVAEIKTKEKREEPRTLKRGNKIQPI